MPDIVTPLVALYSSCWFQAVFFFSGCCLSDDSAMLWRILKASLEMKQATMVMRTM